jgi:hypothetical protein
VSVEIRLRSDDDARSLGWGNATVLTRQENDETAGDVPRLMQMIEAVGEAVTNDVRLTVARQQRW